MPLFRIKITKDVDYCFSINPRKYRLEKVDEDNEYNHFEGIREDPEKSQEIMMLINCYEVYNTLENIVHIQKDDPNIPNRVDDGNDSIVIFMLNADPRFNGAMIQLGEVFDNTIIFLEDLETVEEKQRKILDQLNFDKTLKNFYRALRFPSSLLDKSTLGEKTKIVLYENSVSKEIMLLPL